MGEDDEINVDFNLGWLLEYCVFDDVDDFDIIERVEMNFLKKFVVKVVLDVFRIK